MKCRPHGTGLGLLSHDLRPLATKHGSDVGTFLARRHFDVGNGRNGGECLPAKAFRRKRKQIVGRLEFGGGVAFKTHPRILRAHPRPVVQHLNGRAPGIHHVHFNRRRASIDGVLDQLLHDRRGSLDDFASRNLVGNVVGQNVNGLAHPFECMK